MKLGILADDLLSNWDVGRSKAITQQFSRQHPFKQIMDLQYQLEGLQLDRYGDQLDRAAGVGVITGGENFARKRFNTKLLS